MKRSRRSRSSSFLLSCGVLLCEATQLTALVAGVVVHVEIRIGFQSISNEVHQPAKRRSLFLP